ncbi:hypothetical protein AVEN_13923-1 [Araneus ventricosus]|uniref:DUF4817 domain-containing protein n=1 Tax=Araneus ventricosus TaxID=182803 RepID=A0A4Y2NIU2_ARAVE|nr:hypothetical protein AVEN_13923-1 [Araneus ventricosus]
MCVLWFFETKSVITTQRRFRTTYKKDPPSDNSIRRWLTQFQETGSVLHRKGAGRPSTSQENVDRIQETFTRSPSNAYYHFVRLSYSVPTKVPYHPFNYRVAAAIFIRVVSSYGEVTMRYWMKPLAAPPGGKRWINVIIAKTVRDRGSEA